MDSDVATARAPASIGNVAVGFDVLGCAVQGLEDRVTVRRLDAPTVRMGRMSGVQAEALPSAPADNTAGAALQSFRAALGLENGFSVSIEKGIPLTAWLGGSAASAVGAVVAAAALLPEPMGPDALLPHALAGEAVASGDRHPDNVVPCLYGGLALTQSMDPPDVVSLPVPSGSQIVLVKPEGAVATREARARLPLSVPVQDATAQMAHLGAFVAGCFQDDPALVSRALHDRIAEPHRATLVSGFADVQAAAREAGALGSSFSGAGPTLFAWCDGATAAEQVCAAMTEAFADHDVATEAWKTSVSAQGAHVLNGG
ncbi:MAG: homoserine kinase [Salinibacter sp.]